MDYVLGMIEHNFGRSPVLAQSFARSIEKLLLAPGMFLRLVWSI